MEPAKLIVEFVKVIIWPVVTIVVLNYFKEETKSLLKRLASIKVGDKAVEFFKSEIIQAQKLSAEVAAEPSPHQDKIEQLSHKGQMPIQDVNAQMMKYGLQPSPSGLDLAYYRDLAYRDPKLSLAGLRIELEIIGRNLAKGFNIPLGRDLSVRTIFSTLAENQAITSKQYLLAEAVIGLSDKALDGATVSVPDAIAVIDSAKVLRDEYLAWLSWGFVDDK